MTHIFINPALVAAWLIVAVPAAGSPVDCLEPNVVVLFDVSGSMKGDKYSQAQKALHQVTQSTEADIRYGLMFFPEPGAYPVRCNMGTSLSVPIALHNWDAIYRKTSPTLYGSAASNPEYFGGPKGHYDTPMYQALEHAAGLPELADDARRNYVILLTDGVQDCCNGGDYDDDKDCDPTKSYTHPAYHIPAEYQENRLDLIDQVTAMSSAGISTFVVGFGSRVDAETLDALAVAGGTARTDCAGTGDCYYQANDEAGLTGALAAIARIAREEVCDGLDNDCDGDTDEDVTEACESICGAGERACVDGAYGECDAPSPATEVCDGLDNDCDDLIDEGCDCVHGDTQSCGTDVGVCVPGTQTCAYGVWGACEGGVMPGTEICAGRDDEDCDGLVDEGCRCVNGNSEACGTDLGVCSAGLRTCVSGAWGPCEGEVTGSLTDSCDNGLDDDCDGFVDEYCDCDDGDARACGSSLGICEPGVQTCRDGVWGDCEGDFPAQQETCNNIDDDCDGEVDNPGDDRAGCPQGSACICGTCVVPCAAGGACPLGSVCSQGYCIIDSCPAGYYCDGTQCVPETAPPAVPPEAAPEDLTGASYLAGGVQRRGCGCQGGGLASGALLWVGAMATRRRRRRVGAAAEIR